MLTAVVLLLAVNQHWLGIGGASDNIDDGMTQLFEVLAVLALLPAAAVFAGLSVAKALRLRRWVAVGFLGPASFLIVQGVLHRWPALFALACYAGVAAATAIIPDRAEA